ncbi:MAG: TVP38/TMEM64 family protein [Bacillota bacterium]
MRKKPILAAAIVLVAAAAAIALIPGQAHIIKTIFTGDVTAISEAISGAGAAAILLSVLLNTVISVMGVIPSVFLTAANILVFGFWGGFLVSWAGEVVGATVSFILYRAGIRSVLKVSPDQWHVIRAISQLPGIKQIYFMTVLRLAPFFPSGVINLFGALTSIPLANFFIATAVGKLPALLLESSFSYNVITIEKNYIYLGISVLAAVLLYFTVKKEFSRLKKSTGQKP